MGVGLDYRTKQKLSDVVIDVNKDWAAKRIENLGTPDSEDDALSRGLVDIYSSDYGLNWADLGVITAATISCMVYLGNGIAIMADDTHVYRSTDYGATWTDLGVIATLWILRMVDLGNGIVILSDDSHIFRSTDYGATWADLGAIATDSIVGMAYLGNGIAILGSDDYHVYRSTDYGATWADLGVIATDYIRAMAYLGNGIAILGDDDYHVWRSTDYGLNWADLGVIATDYIYTMAYLGNGIAILGDYDYHVWRSTDYGATWADLGAITTGRINAMVYLGNGIAILGDSAHHVWRSTDYGATWADLGAITTDLIWAMAYLDNGIAILGDAADHVYRSTSAFQLGNFNRYQPVGGLYGINVETLSGDKTLTPGTDKMYQYLDEGDASRIITLATAGAQAGDRFVIRHNGTYNDTNYLEVKQAAVLLDRIYAGAIKEFVFDGTDWISRAIGTGENDDKIKNVAIGFQTRAYSSGTAVGNQALAYGSGVGVGHIALGYLEGVAVGYSAQGHTYGVGIGHSAKGYTNGIGVGYHAEGFQYGIGIGWYAKTNSKKYSIALGYRSECERTGETSVNINGDDSDQENNVVQGRWEGQLAGGAGATEIFCAGQANQRFTIRANSVLAFKMTIVARDNVANEVAMYTVEDGLIKRDGAGNTVMVNCTVTVVHEDDAAWDVAVTADDTNEALIITVTGDDTNPTQFAAVMDGVETHF